MEKIEKKRLQLVAELREQVEAKTTQEELGHKIGKSQNSLSRILNGKYNTKLSTMIALGEAVGLELTWRKAK